VANSTSLFFDIFGRDRGVSDMLDHVAGRADNTNERINGMSTGMVGAARASAGIISGLTGVAVGLGLMASSAEQNTGAVEKVFGSAAGKVQEFASKSADAVGLSGSSYDELSAVIGTALKAAGVSVDDLAVKNDELITRGADMAAVFGGTTADAVKAMGSAFRGEFDPLERYGVQLTMNQVNAELAARGQDNLGGSALEAAKKQAIMDLILRQSAGSAGQFKDETNTAAVAQQKATASFEDAGAKLGTVLLPAMVSLAQIAVTVAKWVQENSTLVTNLAIVLGVLAGGVIAVTAVQWAMNIAMAANPIGLVILAVAGLIAVIVILSANWEHVTRFMTDTWNGFVGWLSAGMGRLGQQWSDFWTGAGSHASGVFSGTTKFLSDTWNGFTGWFNDGMGRVGRQWQGLWDGVNILVRNVWNGGIGPILNTLMDVVQNKVPGAFRSAVGFVEGAWNRIIDVAKSPVRFVVNTVINGGLIDTFNTVASWLPGVGRLPRVSLPPGFAGGGFTGEGGKHEPKGVVHGGEFVLTKEQTSNAGVGNLYKLARALDGYAYGGFVNPLKSMRLTQGYNRVHKGIDLAAGVGTPVFASQDGVVRHAGPGARAPGVWGGTEIHIGGAGGIETWFAHLSRLMVRVGQQVNAGQQIAMSGNTGITSGPHLHFGMFRGGWPNDINPLSFLGGAGIPGGGSTGDGGVFNPLEGIMSGLAGAFKAAFPSGGIVADVAIGVGRKLVDNATKWVTDKFTDGSTGSAAGMRPQVFDEGGWLDSLGQNRTGRPEAVLTPKQSADFHRLATTGLNLDGYELRLNSDATMGTFRRIAGGAATGAISDANDDIYRGRAR
jgi:murein DD-endopeptidase MepM/ murein hydrolase activator NlpD